MLTETDTTKEQIVASSLNVVYFPGQTNEVRSLSDINISIKKGEFIIFFGPSGCGKSTLLYSIANLEKFQGDIIVDGRKIKELNKKEKVDYHRNYIGMVFQAFHLIPTLSVSQNVSLPLISAGVEFKERRERTMELLTRFGVKNQADKLPNELSGGQQQRVAICRAVINNPEIILADEPLGNLDSKSANEVIQLFKEINSKLGKTVILVTHDPTFLDIAHRVFFIKDGKLIDTKVNKNVKEKITTEDNFGKVGHVKELDFISNHYSKLKSAEPDFLIRSFQARNMATLALAGITSDDFDTLREKIEGSLRHPDNFMQVMRYLDDSPENGGLGLDSRTAEKITDQIRSLAGELSAVERLPEVDGGHVRDEEVKKEEEQDAIVIRKMIFDELDINLKHYESLGIVDTAILSRLRGEIDRKQMFLAFNQPLKKGGAGIDKRIANRMVKRLEIWLIGHKEQD